MNATAILEKIQEDARQNAVTILHEANDRADKLRRESDKRIANAKAQAENQAKADGEVEEQRLIRMAELDERKRVLAAKRQLIVRAFDKALERMKAMPGDKARAFLLGMVAQLAAGDERLIPGADNCAWLDDQFLKDANAEMQKRGRKAELTLDDHKREGVSGLILAKADTEINCSYEAILNSQRLELEADVAQALFPAK